MNDTQWCSRCGAWLRAEVDVVVTEGQASATCASCRQNTNENDDIVEAERSAEGM